MSHTIAIDISTFIWCKDDFENNKNHHYKLLAIAPVIFEQIKTLNLPILLRNELCDSLLVDFPYNMIREISYEFERLTLNFLTNTKWFLYSENEDKSYKSVPVLAKKHFTELLKIETQSQIIHLFQNGKNPEHKYISYEYFFKMENNLLVLKGLNNIVEIDTLCYSSEDQVVKYFIKFKRLFEHNPKHDLYKAGGLISPLSCYNEREGDKAKAQELLDNALFHEGHFYNYDTNNKVFVRFIKTSEYVYHGHDLVDREDIIPIEVKNKINK